MAKAMVKGDPERVGRDGEVAAEEARGVQGVAARAEDRSAAAVATERRRRRAARRLARTRFRPTSPSRTGRSSGTRRRSSSSRSHAGGETGLGWTYGTLRGRGARRRASSPTSSRARTRSTSGARLEAMGARSATPGRPGHRSDGAVRRRHRALGSEGAAARASRSSTLLGARARAVPVYGSGGFCSYRVDRLREQLGGWVDEGIPRVKMKVGREPERRPARGSTRRARRSATTPSSSSTRTARSRAQAGARAGPSATRRVGRDAGSRSRSPPPTSTGLRLLRERGPAGLDIAAGEYAYVARRLPQPARAERRLPAGRRDALRRHHRLARGRRRLRRARARRSPATARRDLAPTRSAPCRTAAAPRVLPRPRPHRAHALRRRARAGGRRAPARPLASRARPRAEARATQRPLAELHASTTIREPACVRRGRASSTPRASRRAARGDRGRGALRRRQPRALRDRRLELPPGADRRRHPARRRGRRRDDPRVCREHGAPIVSRGGGTSLAGQCCNIAVVIDFSKYLNRILEIDPERRARARRSRAASSTTSASARSEQHGLTFGPDPSTHDHCTLGGMIGNNSCGVHSVHGGVLRARAADVATTSTSSTSSPTTASGCRSAASGDGRRPTRSTRGSRALADRVRRPDPRALPGHPAPRLRLQPRRAAAGERLRRRARAGRHRGHVRHHPRGDASQLIPTARRRARSSCSATRTSTAPPTTCRACSSTGRSASKASTTRWSRT